MQPRIAARCSARRVSAARLSTVRSSRSGASIAVVGGGLLGTLVAVMLGRAGHRVEVLDARRRLWDGASGVGEGKVHLGFVYARAEDASVLSMLQAAARFAPDVEHALGRSLDWSTLAELRFEYLVAHDSDVDAAAFEGHGARVRRLAAEVADGSWSYLGRPEPPQVTATTTDRAGAWFETTERAVDVPALRDEVLTTLTAAGAKHRAGVVVDRVERTRGRWTLASEDGTVGRFDAVVNCAWEGAPALDEAAGRRRATTPNLRLRAFVEGVSDGPPRAVTVTHGPYGDFARFAGGRTYASWYPTGLLGFVEATEPPACWTSRQTGRIDDDGLAESILEGLGSLVPEARSVRHPEVRARVVVAEGATDIDDPESGLHQRADVGVEAADGWVTVRSPKLTTAPWMARRAAEASLQVLG